MSERKPLDPETKKIREEWKQEEILKRKQRIIDEAKLKAEQGDGVYTGPATAEEELLKNDWDRLIVLARIKFPEHLAAKFNLRPQQRAAAVAWALGWPIVKIAEASDIHRNTISKWLNQDEVVKEFIKAFNYHNNPTNVKELIDNELYSSILVMKELRDDPQVSASTRADVAKWFWEQKFGKAKEAKEIRGVNLRELTEELMKTNSLLDEVEDQKN